MTTDDDDALEGSIVTNQTASNIVNKLKVLMYKKKWMIL